MERLPLIAGIVMSVAGLAFIAAICFTTLLQQGIPPRDAKRRLMTRAKGAEPYADALGKDGL